MLSGATAESQPMTAKVAKGLPRYEATTHMKLDKDDNKIWFERGVVDVGSCEH
jgi:hypothetical protein